MIDNRERNAKRPGRLISTSSKKPGPAEKNELAKFEMILPMLSPRLGVAAFKSVFLPIKNMQAPPKMARIE